MPFYMYILESQITGNYYVGQTIDLDSRLTRHNAGRMAATRSRRPWSLVYYEEFPDRSAAVRREMEIKSWKSSTAIERFIKSRKGQERPD